MYLHFVRPYLQSVVQHTVAHEPEAASAPAPPPAAAEAARQKMARQQIDAMVVYFVPHFIIGSFSPLLATVS